MRRSPSYPARFPEESTITDRNLLNQCSASAGRVPPTSTRQPATLPADVLPPTRSDPPRCASSAPARPARTTGLCGCRATSGPPPLALRGKPGSAGARSSTAASPATANRPAPPRCTVRALRRPRRTAPAFGQSWPPRPPSPCQPRVARRPVPRPPLPRHPPTMSCRCRVPCSTRRKARPPPARSGARRFPTRARRSERRTTPAPTSALAPRAGQPRPPHAGAPGSRACAPAPLAFCRSRSTSSVTGATPQTAARNRRMLP